MLENFKKKGGKEGKVGYRESKSEHAGAWEKQEETGPERGGMKFYKRTDERESPFS